MFRHLRPSRGRSGVVAGLGSIVALSVLAACSGQSESTPSNTSRKLTSTTARATGDIDQLTWNLSAGEPDVIDPANAATYSGGTVVDNLCDPLIRVRADYSTEPNLASLKQVSPTRLVMSIRDDVTFWDGSKLTAEDVAYSLNRSADPSRIVGFVFEKVKSIKVTGPAEVTVDFKQPDELFAKEMGAIAGVVVQKKFAQAAGKKFGTAAGGLMCSGPFELKSWKSGDSITMTRNDHYWNDDYRARPATVKFTFISDSTALTQALDAGEIDGAYEISPTAIPALEKSSTGTLRFGPSTQGLALDVARTDGPLKDARLRQALQVLVDRDALAKVVYKGAATPSYTHLTPTTWERGGRAIYQKAYDRFVKERAHDEAAAKRLVGESSYDGTKIVVAYEGGNQTYGQVAQLVQQQAKQAGLEIELRPMQSLEFSQAQYDASKRGGVDLMLNSSFNGVQDPVEPTGFVYLPTSVYNYTNYDNPEVTKLISQIRASFDVKERARLFVKAQDIYERDNGGIPLLSTNTVSFLNKNLTGAVTSFAYWSMPSMALIGSAG
ncbi:ABC transporter substrate-binding protein [Streptomyces sp. HC44]|uniref:ABC transporter substrate-binding protein n=1 Tax=Streptomyces scabichelini TaxID=2711217 RepID=A0A6G4VC11_9ACTN|nr:ABC transporter substrate-binding protein [Streptomyces scabichelini]NGO11357.1 ABC transporter substrate-binding protein [Streptomyces scabichelini]